MTCMVEWYLRSGRPVTEDEKAALLELGTAEQSRPWQQGRFVLMVLGGGGGVLDLIAGGSTDMPEDVSHSDWTMLLDVLTRMRLMVPDFVCEVRDEQRLISWNAEANRYETRGWDRPVPQSPPPPVREDSAEERAVREVYARVLAAGSDAWQVRRELEVFPADVVVRIGLDVLRTAPPADYRAGRYGGADVAVAIRDAGETLAAAAPVEPAIAAVWDAHPSGDLAANLARALETLAHDAIVRDRATRAVASSATDTALRTAGIQLLGAARGSAAEAVPVLVARVRDDRLSRSPAPWRDEALSALERLRRREAFATFLLEGNEDASILWRVIGGLAACDPNRALPFLLRMRDVSDVSKESLVRAIADGTTDAATDALISFREFPLGDVRAIVADRLLARQRLVEVAAIWKSLDAVGFTHYTRSNVLRAFGQEQEAEAAVDWDALVRARGLTPFAIAPVPARVDLLVHPDRYVRASARNALEKAAEPAALVAYIRSLQLEAELARLDRPYCLPGLYAWRDVLSSLGCTAIQDDDVIAWVLANAHVWPDQLTSPALEAIAREGAAAVAAQLAHPRFDLTDDERASFDAEEASIAATARVPDAGSGVSPGPPAAVGGDTFDGPHPEVKGETLPPDRGLGLSPELGALMPSWVAEDGLIALENGQAVGGVRRWDDEHVGVHFVVIVRRRTRWLRFLAFDVVLRDDEGRALHAVHRSEDKQLDEPARVGIDSHVTRAAFEQARLVELRATVREPFQVRAGRWRLGAFETTRCNEVPLASIPEPSIPELPGLASPVRASATCHVVSIRGNHELDLLVELALTTPAFAITPVQVAIVFRDRQAKIIDLHKLTLVLPADGSSVLQETLFGLRVGKAETLEVLVRGARTQTAPLATFSLSPREQTALAR